MNALQRTDEWRQARLGKLTASRLGDAIARIRSGWGVSRSRYMAELLLERVNGVWTPSYVSAAMQWGIDHEADGVANYEMERNVDVAPVGFVAHPAIANAGASPDGLIGSDGLLEIKCPDAHTHLQTLIGKKIDAEHHMQMQWQMACTARSWCDFVSYDPRFKGRGRIFIKRVHREDKVIARLAEQVQDFLAELDAKERAYRAEYDDKEIAA